MLQFCLNIFFAVAILALLIKHDDIKIWLRALDVEPTKRDQQIRMLAEASRNRDGKLRQRMHTLTRRMNKLEGNKKGS